MSVGQPAGIGLGVVDELSQRVSRHCGMDRKGKSRNCHVRNRLEVLKRIVEWMAFENGLRDVSARTTQENSVAVRAGASDRGGTERTASSPLVFNHHGAKHRLHLFRPRTPHVVVAAARGERNDEPDRTIRIFGLSARGPKHRRPQRQRSRTKGE